MKKFLLYFLLSTTVNFYSYSGMNRAVILKSSVKESVSNIKKIKKLVYIYPKGIICRGYNNAVAATPMLWSSSSSWAAMGTTKPVAGSAVTIPAGVHMILDESPPNLASLNISGKLEFAQRDLSLTAGWIMVMGTLEVGTPTMPYVHKATITLNATNPDETIMGMGTRGIMVMGGKLELHGVPPTKLITKLNDNAAAGATTLSLLDPVSWNMNDQIVIATSDFYGAANGTAQRTQITTINSTTSLTIQEGLNAQRWGKLQYLTVTGMSLTPGTLPANLSPGTPTVLDERAEVANLTRNIVVQSVDDNLWQNNGFGCHIMIMRMNDMVGEARLNSVEIRRGGQAGKLGRYPFHWHMLSYQGSTTLPDVTGQYIRNSTINQSAQRGIVIHGTNGAEVRNNVVYDIRGHGIFTEDASERRNIIDGNLVLKVRTPSDNNVLKQHESRSNRLGSSGFWISNPDNTVTNNTAADCFGVGFWLAFPERTFGASAAIALTPRFLKFGTFNNNHAHSNQQEGIFLDGGEIDELGNTGVIRYTSTTDMREPQWPYPTLLEYELSNYSVWKNNNGGIWNNSVSVRNRRVVSADNHLTFFTGVGDMGLIEKSLAVGVSFNYNMNGVTRPTSNRPTADVSTEPAAFASYHSTFDLRDNVAVNFEGVKDRRSGAFALNDYYITPVDKGTFRNPGNIIINSHPGVRTLPFAPQFVFGVIWDPYDYWGGPASQDNYYVFNNPFFTDGLSSQSTHIVPPSREVSGGVIVEGPFYGFYNYYINGVERIYDKINVIRTNTAGATVGNWVVEAGAPGDILGNMRHFATHPTGYYYLDFPTIDNVNDFAIRVTNMVTANDHQVLAVEYSGDYTITEFFANAPGQENRPYTAVSDFQAVVNAPTGEVYWQDKNSNKVWVKVRGGVNPGDPNSPSNNDWNLYKEFKINASGIYTPLNVTSPEDGVTFNRIYPNPTKNIVTIEYYAQNTEGLNFTVNDAIGRELTNVKTSSTVGKNVNNLNFDAFPDGVYFITVKNGNDVGMTRKIVKN